MTQTKFQTHNRKTTQRPNHDAKQHNKNINRKITRRPKTEKKKKAKQTTRTPRSRTLNQHKERQRQKTQSFQTEKLTKNGKVCLRKRKSVFLKTDFLWGKNVYRRVSEKKTKKKPNQNR